MSDELQNAKPILDRFKLDGRVALVTGGGQGIGRAFAHALAEAGAAVAVVDIVPERAEVVAAEITAKGAESLAITTDVTQADQVQAMITQITRRWDTLTIGVNNAGIGDWTAALDVDDANWTKINDVNLKGVFLCAQAEARVMFEAGYGKIINTASMSGSIVNTPQPQSVYNLTKAGVIHLSKSLAAEWAPQGIRVNTISPGYTQTRLMLDLLERPETRAFGEQWRSLTPAGRFGEVTDLQGALVYLASEASDFMTGHDMVIDGGYSVW